MALVWSASLLAQPVFSLRVKEADGAPNVPGVLEITVPVSALVSNSPGKISLNFSTVGGAGTNVVWPVAGTNIFGQTNNFAVTLSLKSNPNQFESGSLGLQIKSGSAITNISLWGTTTNHSQIRLVQGAVVNDSIELTHGDLIVEDGEVQSVGGFRGSAQFLTNGNATIFFGSGEVPLARGGTGSSLTDPGAHRLWGWDDTDNAIGFWTPGSGLAYEHSTHTLTAPGILNVQEEDGNPSVNSVTQIKVSNGTLVNNGGGSVSIMTGGGGEGEATNVLSRIGFGYVTNNLAVDETGDAEKHSNIVMTVTAPATAQYLVAINSTTTTDESTGIGFDSVVYGYLSWTDWEGQARQITAFTLTSADESTASDSQYQTYPIQAREGTSIIASNYTVNSFDAGDYPSTNYVSAAVYMTVPVSVLAGVGDVTAAGDNVFSGSNFFSGPVMANTQYINVLIITNRQDSFDALAPANPATGALIFYDGTHWVTNTLTGLAAGDTVGWSGSTWTNGPGNAGGGIITNGGSGVNNVLSNLTARGLSATNVSKFRMATQHIIVTNTPDVVLDLAQYQMFRVLIQTNASFVFSNQAEGISARLILQQGTNGTHSTVFSVAGGLLQTNASLQMTTNADALDVLEVASGYFSTNLVAWWPQDMQPRIADPREYNPAPPFEVDAATFDGSNDYITRGANLTGIADGKKGIISLWAKFAADDTGIALLAGNDNALFQLVRESDNTISFRAGDGSSYFARVSSNDTYTSADGWIHILISWDLTTTTVQMSINDGADTGSVLSNSDNNITYTALTDWGIAAYSGGGAKLNGCLAELYFNSAEALDISNSSNRRKFISATLHPVDLGSDGSTPTGTQPILYVKMTTTPSNAGSGGSITVNSGPYSTCATP
jgi:hypothetical protein